MHTWVRAIAVATLAVSAVAVPQADAAPAQATTAERSVTLITGDRVLIETGHDSGYLLPGPGREGIGFSTFQADGHSYVLPVDASPLVAKGALDLRLFDVTELLADGYDDAGRATLPLLATYPEGGSTPQALSSSPGTRVTRSLPSVNGAALTADKASASELWDNITGGNRFATAPASGIKKIWLDGKRKSTLDRSVPQIGAPAAWQAGYHGEGTTVAVLDTGVDQTHPDLADRETAERNFSDAPDNADHFGHGTHVASIVAGTGAKSGGKYKGVAYGAQILDGKVLNDNGSGQESWIIAGMEWAAEQGAKVANLSLGGTDTPEIDPLEEAVNTLSAEHGTLFVIAAGNSGPRKSTVGSPGSAAAALTVGAVDRDNAIAPFSSRGPAKDGSLKPDITAPGVGIVAALHSDGTIGQPVEPGYTALSGTSMATPHVTGAAALLAQQHPDLTGGQLKALLTASAAPTSGLTAFDQGAGRVDSARALTQQITSEPAGLGFGTQLWPHDDDQPVSKDITYRNAGDTDVTLDLAVEAIGPDGQPAPSGVFTPSTTKLTVPAHGQATATVTGDTRAAKLDGGYSGALVASAGDARVRSPLAIDREVESYDLTLTTTDRAGAATGEYSAFLYNMDTGDFLFPYEEDGSVTVRVPKGRYILQDTVGRGTYDILAYPNLTVNGTMSVDLDARLAKPISVTPPNQAAELALGVIGLERTTGTRSFSSSFLTSGGLDGIASAHLGPELPAAELSSTVNTQWTAADGAEYYGLAWYAFGKATDGFTRVVTPAEVATVKANYAGAVAGKTGYVGALPTPHLGTAGGWGVLTQTPLPRDRTEYYTPDGVDWSKTFSQTNPDTGAFEASLDSPPTAYQAGRNYSETLNRAVFGPVLPVSYYPSNWVSRQGDTISVYAPLFGDSTGASGSSTVDTAYTRLYRDGEQVGETNAPGSGLFEVPAGDAEYRIATDATRSVSDLSTRVSAAWTFRSNTTTGVTRLPISTIRFFPALDDASSAPSGGPFLIPVAVQEQGNAVTQRPYKLTAEASYDGGQTWVPATVIDNVQLAVQHPAGAGAVSLRAKATDGNGNTVEQTIINAYKLR